MGRAAKTGRTTKEWYFLKVTSYDLLKLSLNSSDRLVILRRSAVAVNKRPLPINEKHFLKLCTWGATSSLLLQRVSSPLIRWLLVLVMSLIGGDNWAFYLEFSTISHPYLNKLPWCCHSYHSLQPQKLLTQGDLHVNSAYRGRYQTLLLTIQRPQEIESYWSLCL